MIQATGLPQTYGTSGSGTHSVGLEAQLSRLQQELSNCVNCESAKTTEGKTKIQSVEAKINAIKARMESGTAQTQQISDAKEINKTSENQQVNHNQTSYENNPIAGGAVGSIINISA